MSASTKKQLRKAQEAEKLTEKQLAEQKEAKKLKLYSTIAVVVLAALVLFAAVYGVNQAISNSGVRQRSTVAMTVGEHQISNAELNYYFIDAVNNFYNNYGSYASLFGLDTTKALDKQEVSEGRTWADDFLKSATENITSIYALNDEAKPNGFALTEEDLAAIDSDFTMMEFYAQYYYGYADLEGYLKGMYGNGATVDSYRQYYEMSTLAENYEHHYSDSLTYSDADLRAAEAENFNQYSSYNYNSYYQTVSAFHDSEATDEQITAAQKMAESAVKKLAEGEYATAADFDAAIAAMEVNADKAASSSSYKNTVYSSVSATYKDWVADSSRQAGDVAYFPATSTDSEGNESVVGYYVVYFNSANTNEYPLANVRHILIAPEGGTTDSTTGTTTYSDEEMAAAKAAAEELYAQWKAGEATEESFAALANEKSADGDGTTGGLFEDVYPGQMVTNFDDWCFDASRKAGDTGIVESEYGYHIMYYVSDSTTSYRDYLITNDLVSADVSTWFIGLVDSMTVTTLDTKYFSTDLVISK